MKLVKDYMMDTTARHALNDLTQETFGFDFEGWVTKGYFEGDYIPYSYEENGKFIANVSANRMHFVQNGEEKYFIQIGTVMTKKEYRNQGYARKLMKEVMAEYEGKCDGFYLLGDMGALDFYRKLGFVTVNQYHCFLKEEVNAAIKEACKSREESERLLPLSHMDEADKMNHKRKYMEMLRYGTTNSVFELKNRFGLQMFHTSSLERVYYSKDLDCYVVMEEEDDGSLNIQSVISNNKISLMDVLTRLPGEYTEIVLGFTPCEADAELFDMKLYDGEDFYRMFIYGEELKRIETEKLYFPEMTHA